MNTFPVLRAALLAGACSLLVTACLKQEGGSPGPVSGSAPADSYPLTTCVVSGEELGSMGDPYIHTHEGVTVKFCCESCLEKFNADPAKYLAKLEAMRPGQ